MNNQELHFPNPIAGVSERIREMANVSDVYKETGGNWKACQSYWEAHDVCLFYEQVSLHQGINLHVVGGSVYKGTDADYQEQLSRVMNSKAPTRGIYYDKSSNE